MRVPLATRHSLPAALAIFIALTPVAGAQTETVLFNFSTASGDIPFAGVTPDGAGNLYGTVYDDGPSGYGVVYKLDRSGRYSVLHAFTGGADGGGPSTQLVRDTGGNFYGTTLTGGTANLGVIFKVSPTGQVSVIHSFTGGSGGATPRGDLLLDSFGNLYGTTADGGTPLGYGTVFVLDPAGHFKIIHSFTGPDGAFPYSGVVRDAQGNLYGTTTDDSGAHAGLVYKIDPQGNETVLYTFSGLADGFDPNGGLVLDGAGNLYGTTSGGGSYLGVVYKVDPSGRQTVLHTFAGPPEDGSNPQYALTFDASGNLFGTTAYGGTSGLGAVFKIDRATHQETLLYSFTGPDGDQGSGPLIIVNGNLFGTTSAGGNGGGHGGVIFKLTQAQ